MDQRPSLIGKSYPIPDTLQKWPWDRSLNPNYEETKAQSEEWFAAVKPSSSKSQHMFDLSQNCLLASLAFPAANPYNLRSCCDLMHTFFSIEESTDKADVSSTKANCYIAIDAIENPDKPRPIGEVKLGEIARQFWQRAKQSMTPAAQERFTSAWRAYLQSVSLQAEHRATSYICSIEEYMSIRRPNLGAMPCFVLLETCLEINIPPEVVEHPALVTLRNCAADLIALDNDLFSFACETVDGRAEYNIITVMMSKGLNLADAVQWLADFHSKIVEEFLTTAEDVRQQRRGVSSWGDTIDQQVSTYIDGLGYWVRANNTWSFECGRYFGRKAAEVRSNRRVVIE